jgi:heme-degrading monooxygenase HmoA
MRDTIPQYADLPGLSFKAYSFERASGDYGGVYLWQSRKAAQAWFNAAWFERVKRERGADAQVRSFSAHLVLDNVAGGTPASTDSDSIATLVEIAVPPNTPQERLVAGLRASVPTYQAIPGLLRKYYITSDQGTFGGIYLWKDEASARAWFNPQWHERVTQTYGRPAVIEWFDTPILTPTTNRGNAVPEAFVVGAP